jgi:hypothetical protein
VLVEGFGLLHEGLIEGEVGQVGHVLGEDDHLPELVDPAQGLADVGFEVALEVGLQFEEELPEFLQD